MSLHTWHRQGPRRPSSCANFLFNSHWGRTATGKKSLVAICAGLLWSCLTLCNPVGCGLPGFSVTERGFSRQEYRNALANTGCLPFLSSIISYFPSCQFPWAPGAARTLQSKQLHHLHTWPSQGQTQVLQGSLRSKPHWTTHMQRLK